MVKVLNILLLFFSSLPLRAGMVVTDIDKVALNKEKCVISGKLVSDDNKPVDFATVSLEGTSYGGKFFTKPYFCINPAGKSKVPSWKIFISQLENYFFSVGKSKFRSRAILGEFLGLFLNYFKRFLFILTPMPGLWTKVKMFDIEW